MHGRPLVYLDNANTTQKPQSVIDAERHYYEHDNANIHRATHLLSERATKAYEGARHRVQRFINAREAREVIFTRGCTDGINLVAQSWGRAEPAAGRRDRAHLDGAPLQHRPVAARLRADRGDAPRRADHRRGRARHGGVRDGASATATSFVVGHPRVQRAGHGEPGRADGRTGARAAACRCCSTARRPRRTCRSTCRRSTATSTRSRRTRCTGRPASARSTARPRCSSACRPTRAAAT